MRTFLTGLGVLLLGGLVLGLSYGAAASLDVSSAAVQAGFDDDLVCDEDGVTLSFDVQWNSAESRYDVTGWSVTDIDQPECPFKRFTLRLLWDAPYSDLEYEVSTNTSTVVSGVVSPSRPAAALVAWHIVMYDEASP